MDFLERFRQFSAERKMLSDGTLTLLAVSGGVDSMVMLHVFRAAGLTFGIAHCNFQLRSAASNGDEMFVQKTAAEMEAPFFVKRFDTKLYAEQNGISTQMAARELRYEWFAEIAEQHGYQFVATAHNLNDSVETVLLNFIRGTGLAGMTGMKNMDFELRASNLEILRPLLFASRDEILEYARTNNITWREDSSNASDDYARNFLRHHIVPKMQELNPNFLNTAERNLTRLQETKDNLDFLTREFLGIQNLGSGEMLTTYSIDKQKLAQLPAPRRVLREILKPHGFTEEQARQVAENLDRTGFELQSDSGWRMLCDRTEIVILPQSDIHPVSAVGHPRSILIQEGDLMVRLPNGGTLFMMPADPIPPFPDGSQAAMVDAAAIQFPLTVRHWEEGDTFQPFGMGGQSQKLQDYFTNQKLSRIEKEQVWFLLNGDGAIIWVVGMRLDERFRIGSGTEKGLKFSWL